MSQYYKECQVTSVWKQGRIQDFPEVGVPTLQGGHQHMILPMFPKECMKLKEFGPGRSARPKFYYVDPPLGRYQSESQEVRV